MGKRSGWKSSHMHSIHHPYTWEGRGVAREESSFPTLEVDNKHRILNTKSWDRWMQCTYPDLESATEQKTKRSVQSNHQDRAAQHGRWISPSRPRKKAVKVSVLPLKGSWSYSPWHPTWWSTVLRNSVADLDRSHETKRSISVQGQALKDLVCTWYHRVLLKNGIQENNNISIDMVLFWYRI